MVNVEAGWHSVQKYCLHTCWLCMRQPPYPDPNPPPPPPPMTFQ